MKDILEKHRKWAIGEADGQRADLQRAYLQRAYLQGAYLQGADLQRADLRGADLQGAYLQGADLQRANLQGADLRGAYLQPIKDDFFTKLLPAKNEVVGLYDALMRGRIDGTCYTGECACFCGTIANLRKENHEKLTIDLRPDDSSPTERWFLAILKGHTPDSNPVAQITKEWIEEFAKDHEIILPKYKFVSSKEAPELFV
jgi:hypothetical protein